MSRAYSDNPQARGDAIASTQYGLITRAQAFEVGMTRDTIHYAVRTGRWIRTLPRVYRLAAVPQSWEQELMAAILWAGNSAVASHNSAAALLGFDHFQAVAIELSLTLAKKHASILTHQVNGFGPADRVVHKGIPSTSPARTIVDLAGSLETRFLERTLDDAIRRRFVTLTRMRWQVDHSEGKRGTSVLRELLEERSRDGVTDSDLELDLLRRIKRAGIPMPLLQHQVPGVGRVDLAYPQLKLVIEVDSYGWHFDREAFRQDRARDRAMARIGWRVARVTSGDFDELVEDLRRALCSDTKL